MSDNSEPNPTQTEVTSSEQLVGLVPIEGEEHGIGVQLITSETDEDFFGAQAIELNGERHVIVSQAQDPETGELLLVLRGENGEHIAIQSEALSSMVQASGGENIQVAVETNDETALTLASDISSLSQSVSTTEVNSLSTTLSALPAIIANIPTQTLTTTAPTNVVQAIDTPRVSQEEQPSSLTNISSLTSPVPPKESDQSSEPTILTVPTETISEKIETDHKLEESLSQNVIEEDKTPKLEDTVPTKETIEEKIEKKETITTEENAIVLQPEPEVKEMTELKPPEIPAPEETKVTSEPLKSIETKSVVETDDKTTPIETALNDKNKEMESSNTIKLDSTTTDVTSLTTLTSSSDLITTSCSTEMTAISTPLPTTELMTSVTPTTISVSVPEEKISTNTTESENTVQDLGFGNTAVIQVQDSGNDSAIEQLMANAMLTADGSYVLMAQTEDGQMTGLSSELNLSDVISAGAAGGQTFLIETPEGLVACTASTSGEDGSIQLIPTDTAHIESGVISSAQTSGTSVESQIIQAISGGHPMSYNINSGCIEVMAVNSNQNQSSPQKASRGGRGSRSNKSKTVSSVPSMGQTLLLTTETETPAVVPKPSTQTPARNRGGGVRGKGNRISGGIDSNDSTIVSNSQQLKTNSKINDGKSSTTSVNSLGSETSAPPGPSQLAASRRTYSKKSNIVWITPDASQGANNTTFATVATASIKPSNTPQKLKTTPNCNPPLTKSTDEMTISSRVRTPSPTKTLTSTQTTLTTKTSAVTSIRSTSPTKTSISTPPQTTTTVTKPLDSKTSSNKSMVTTIANKGSSQTTSEKKETTVAKTTPNTTPKTVTANKTTALKTSTQSSSRGQTPNLTIQKESTPIETTTKTTIRVSDIIATKSLAETSKTGTKTVVTVPSTTKTKGAKSGATTISSTTSTVKPIAPNPSTKTVTHSKKPSIPTTNTVESSVSSVKKTISTASLKSTPNPIISEKKDIKSPETSVKELNVSAKQPKTDSTLKPVLTPIAVKSSITSEVSSAKSATNSAEKLNKKSTEKTISNRSVETRHSARLSPTKNLKPEINSKEIDSNIKLSKNSSDLIESKVESTKTINETLDSKKKLEVDNEDKHKNQIPNTQIETSTQKTQKIEETTNKPEIDKQMTKKSELETTEENKSVRKSRRSSRNTTNVEENKIEVKTVDENKMIETVTKESKDIKDKNIKEKEKTKETPIESVSTRRGSRKREVSIEEKTEESSNVSPSEAPIPPAPISTPINEVKPQRLTRASSGKKPDVKQSTNEEKVSKTVDTKAPKEKETETKVESQVKTDFDQIVKESTPSEKSTEKSQEKRPDRTIEKSPDKTEPIPSKTSETPSLTRSVKKRVQFEIKEKPEEQKVSKSSDSKEKTPEVTTPSLTRRSLRSSTPQVVNQTISDDKSDQKEVSDNETNNQSKTDKQINENNNKTPQRFSTRKRKEVTKSAEIDVKEVVKSPKKSKKTESNDIDLAINDSKNDSTESSAVVRLRDRKSKSVKRNESRNTIRDTFRHSIESSDPLTRLNRRQSLIHSYIDENEWHEKEEEMRRKTISSLSDLRSPNECYDYSTNECRFYIRHQSASLTPKQSTGNYLCQKCGFHTTRINNLVIHHRDQCSYVKNQVIQQWQTELQKRVRPSEASLTASTSSPEKRRKTESNDELNNILDKNTDHSDDESEDEEMATNDGKANQNPTISDIDAMLMGSDDEDLLSIDNIEKPKRELGFSEDDIVWVETNSTHWPSLVSKVFPKEKKAMIRLIDSPWTKKSLKADISAISLFDSAEVNKQYLREGRKGSNGDLLVKAVQKAEEFLRKKCLGNELSAAKFFDQIDSDLSEANADEDERLTPNPKDSVSTDTKETAKTSNDSLLDNSLAVVGSNGDDSEVDKMPESNEAIAQWKEKRRQQNAKLLQCIKEGKVETHLVGVYRETIVSERHQKFKSGSESEKNQLKHVPWFGPIDDEEQQEEIYDYCSQLFKSNFKTDGSFDTVAYIFEVWVPEAIVKAISRVRRIELKDSEFIFAKGVILSKTEKDELTKEIQKEAEKQMTSQTSSD